MLQGLPPVELSCDWLSARKVGCFMHLPDCPSLVQSPAALFNPCYIHLSCLLLIPEDLKVVLILWLQDGFPFGVMLGLSF